MASGTFGTLIAVPMCYVLSVIGPFQALACIAAFSGFAVWISGEAEKLFKQKDSRLIVIDEIAGFMVTMFLVPWSAKSVVLGFFLFRLTDIVKPFPIRKVESGFKGGWGVVADDLLAGVYANVLLRLVMRML